MSTVGSKQEQKKSSCLNPTPKKKPPISSSQCFPREQNLHFSIFFFPLDHLHPYFHAPGWFPASRHPSSDGSSSRIPRSRHTWDPWLAGKRCVVRGISQPFPWDPCMLYMVTFTINIPQMSQMLAYIPYMDPMGLGSSATFRFLRP